MNTSGASGAKRPKLSEGVQRQIGLDVQRQIGYDAKSRGRLSGRAITWFAGSDFKEKFQNFWKSLMDPQYAQEVRDEFFRQFHEEIKYIEDKQNLIENILNISDQDLSLAQKYELLAETGYQPELQEVDPISYLKRNAIHALNKMATASVTSEAGKNTVIRELKNLREGFPSDESYAKEVIKILIPKCGKNVSDLIKLANNIGLLFEVPGVQRNFGNVKNEMLEPILNKMHDLLKDKLKNIGGESWQGIVLIALNKKQVQVQAFLDSGLNVERFPMFLAEKAIMEIAENCDNSENLMMITPSIENFCKLNGISEKDKESLFGIVKDYYTRFHIKDIFPNGSKKVDKSRGSLSEYFQLVIIEQIKNNLKFLEDQNTIVNIEQVLKEIKNNVNHIFNLTYVNFSEEEKNQIRNYISFVTNKIVEDKKNDRPIDWLFTVEKHRGFSKYFQIQEKLDQVKDDLLRGIGSIILGEFGEVGIFGDKAKKEVEDAFKDVDIEKLLESGKSAKDCAMEYVKKAITNVAKECTKTNQFIQLQQEISHFCLMNDVTPDEQKALVNILLNEAEKKGVSCFRLNLKMTPDTNIDDAKQAVLDAIQTAEKECKDNHLQLQTRYKEIKEEIEFFSRQLDLTDYEKKELSLMFSEIAKSKNINFG